jgi:hypothetical protein
MIIVLSIAGHLHAIDSQRGQTAASIDSQEYEAPNATSGAVMAPKSGNEHR